MPSLNGFYRSHYFWVKNPRKVRNFLCTEEVGELGELVVAAEKRSFSTLIMVVAARERSFLSVH